MSLTSSPSAGAAAAAPAPKSDGRLKVDRPLKEKLAESCQSNNWTNLLFIARAWAILALTIGGAVWFHQYQQASAGQISFWWNVPVFLVAILIVGASQHQLAGAGHEASHHSLFKNRLMNELVSDWICMYPIFASTYHFRLYHLAHHQFVNDPERDPDFTMLDKSGHWLKFPVTKSKFLASVLEQLMIFPLLRHILVRGRMNSVGMHESSPYRHSAAGSKVPARLSLVYFVGLIVVFLFLNNLGSTRDVLIYGPAYLALGVLTMALVPKKHFVLARIKPVVPLRLLFISRLTFMTLLFMALLYVQLSSGKQIMAMRYYMVLWLIPLVTVFPFTLIMRQIVQHGNADRGWITNTRVFFVNPVVRYALFPFGMDLHTPHHMYATVPHFKLLSLHRFLQRYPEYERECMEVENYLVPGHSNPYKPTVVEVLGPDYAMGESGNDVHLDNSVLEGWDLEEKDEIARHEGDSITKAAMPESSKA